MDHEQAKAAVRGWGMKVTPYRVGIAMGEAEARAFIAWREETKASKDYTKPRPPRAVSPYTANHHSERAWRDGRTIGWKRAGLPTPPGGF